MRSHLLGHCSKHLASLVSREGFWLASELSQQTGALNGEHSSSQGGEENFLHSVGRAKDQESNFPSGSGTLPEAGGSSSELARNSLCPLPEAEI